MTIPSSVSKTRKSSVVTAARTTCREVLVAIRRFVGSRGCSVLLLQAQLQLLVPSRWKKSAGVL